MNNSGSYEHILNRVEKLQEEIESLKQVDPLSIKLVSLRSQVMILLDLIEF